MRLLRLLVAALALLGTQLVSPAAWAQATLTIGPIYEWSNKDSRDGRTSVEISGEDCRANATVTFSPTIMNASGSFEVWIGASCTNLDSRTNGQCFKVAEAALTASTITLNVRDMLQEPSTSAGPGGGTEAVCMGTATQTGAIDLNVFFMLLDAGSQTGEPLANVPIVFEHDITAPDPPTNVEAGPGEESLVVSFTAAVADDLQGYRFYCSEVGPAPEQGAGGAGEEAPAPTGDCTSSVLVPGQAPLEGAIACGSTDAAQATDGTASGLANGTRYVVAIAAQDKFDNVGTLSTLACGTPQEVTGFFEAYRAAGGQGGGGFCSFGPARRGATAIGLALLLVGAMLLRRRK
jgi:hypothetical protein